MAWPRHPRSPVRSVLTSIIHRLAARVAARPGDPQSHAELAAALWEADAQAEAEAARAKARELIAGCLHLGLIDPATAAAEVLHQAFRRPDDAVLLADVTAARQGAGLERARRLVEAVVSSAPDALPARMRAAAFALGAGEAATARRWIEPVAHATADTSALYVQTLLAQGDSATALAEVEAAIQRHPGAAVLWELCGAAALEKNRPDTAIEAFSEVLRLEPERPQAYYNLALAFVRAGSRMAALGVVDAGLEAKPNDSPLVVLRQALLPKVT